MPAKPRARRLPKPRRAPSHATFYDRLSVFYDLVAEASERRPRRRALRALAAGRGERVLEIGVGTGRALPALVRAVGPEGRVLGIDVASGMLRVARRHIASVKLERAVALQRADARALPYRSEVLDALFMSFTLELFDETEIPVVLGEVRRVLRRGGRLCVVSLVEGPPKTRRARLFRWFRRRWPRLIDCRPIALEALLEREAFRPRSTQTSDVAGLPVRIVVAAKPARASASLTHGHRGA
jgi:demethylmenaquinone methyltransferase/2-methoxy-6-polyprenyl-1,4-benzoquinol methylase